VIITAVGLGLALLYAVLVAALVVTYVWSPNADRRTRAQETLLMLIGWSRSMLVVWGRRAGSISSPSDMSDGHEDS
jgi:hypothetical protein